MLYFLRAVAVALLPALVEIGCVSTSPDCDFETRELEADATLSANSATGQALLHLFDTRFVERPNDGRDGLGWNVFGSVEKTSVTAIHVHETATGRVLIAIPIGGQFAQSGAQHITGAGTSAAYPGPVSFDEVFDLLGRSPAFVDIHTTDDASGQLRGDVRVTRRDTAWIRNRCG